MRKGQWMGPHRKYPQPHKEAIVRFSSLSRWLQLIAALQRTLNASVLGWVSPKTLPSASLFYGKRTADSIPESSRTAPSNWLPRPAQDLGVPWTWRLGNLFSDVIGNSVTQLQLYINISGGGGLEKIPPTQTQELLY